MRLTDCRPTDYISDVTDSPMKPNLPQSLCSCEFRGFSGRFAGGPEKSRPKPIYPPSLPDTPKISFLDKKSLFFDHRWLSEQTITLTKKQKKLKNFTNFPDFRKVVRYFSYPEIPDNSMLSKTESHTMVRMCCKSRKSPTIRGWNEGRTLVVRQHGRSTGRESNFSPMGRWRHTAFLRP
jgi:hypothetical protein